MKFWITRLDETVITAANYEFSAKKGGDDSFSSSNTSVESEQGVREMRVCELLRSVINHSRTLSLSLYEHELIYCKMQGFSFYYRAKHNLLFVFAQEPKEDLDLSVKSIDIIILETIKYFESVCESLRCNYNLPRKITDYQKSQLQKIYKEIIEIVIKEDCSSLEVSALRREPSFKEEDLAANFKERSQGLASIQYKNNRLRRQPSLFERYANKNVLKYKLKLYFLIFMVVLLMIMAPIIIFYGSGQQGII